MTTSWDATARVWDARDWSHTRTLAGHAGAVTMCAFAPDGRELVTLSRDLALRVRATRPPPSARNGKKAGVVTSVGLMFVYIDTLVNKRL